MMPDLNSPTQARERLADELDVVRDRVLAGPNRWRREPSITGDVLPRALAEHPAQLGDALARLRAELPALDDVTDAAAPASDGGAAWADAVARLAIALQRQAGSAVTDWRAVGGGDEPQSWAFAIGYEEEGVGLASVRAAARLLRRAVAGDALRVADVLDDLRERRERESLGPTTSLLVAAARRRDIPVRRYPGEHVVQLGTGCRQHRVDATVTDRTSVIATDIASDGDRTKGVLGRFGVPVPRGDVVRTADDALDMADRIGFPVVLKPLDAGNGRGISSRLDSGAQVREAFAVAHAEHSRVVVERWVDGRDHRVLVVNGRVIAVAERTGDTPLDRTSAIHPENAAICAFAADVVGLDIAGVDVVSADIARPFRENGAMIVGVNAAPGIGIHMQHETATSRDVPGAIVDALFPPGTPTRIPVVAVTGTNGKTTTTRLIAHLLRHAGNRVGFTTTDGVYVGEQLIFEGDMTGPMAADMILANPRLDAAVLETARGGILRAGLGYDECDVGVVLNVTADHLGLRGIHTLEQLADVKAVIVSAVRDDGYAVLNADDPLVLAMRARTRARAVLFSLLGLGGNPALAEHVRAGGMAATIEGAAGGESLVLYRGDERIVLAPVSGVPLTENGAARFQVQNALAASAAAWAIGVTAEVIRAGLARFVPSMTTTPGRMNVVRVLGATIIVDYAHNPAAIRALLDYAHRVDAERRIAVLSIPGDRRDDDIRELGGLGAGVDEVIYLENADYRRGRAEGETGALMIEGLVQAGGDASRAVVVHGQAAAVEEVLRRVRPRDLVLFIADYAGPAIARFEEAG